MKKFRSFSNILWGHNIDYLDIPKNISLEELEAVHQSVFDGLGSILLFYTLPVGCRTVISEYPRVKVETNISTPAARFLTLLIGCALALSAALFFIARLDAEALTSDFQNGMFVGSVSIFMLFIGVISTRFVIFIQHSHYVKHVKAILDSM